MRYLTTTARKALTGALATFAATLGAGMLDGNLTGPEVIVSVGTALAAGAVVYQVPNT